MLNKTNNNSKKTAADLKVYSAPNYGNDGEDIPVPKGKNLKEIHSDAANYQMILEDPQVSSCLQQRYAAITSSEWIVEAGGDRPEDEKAAAFLRNELTRFPFDEATRKMASAVFYGFSVAEIIWQLGDDKLAHIDAIKVRKRERFTFGRNGEVFLNEGNKKTEMPPRKFWTVSIGAEEDDSPYGHGLAHKLYWPVKFKRAAQKAWMTFLNQYGHKVATVRYNQQADEAAKKKALEIAQKVAAGHSIAMPQNMEVILLEGFKASVVADYEKMIANMNDAITKICLSQTMTTDNGASRAQATVHMEVRSEVVKSDADHLCASFNNGPVQWLIAYNFPTAKPPKIWRRFEKEPDLQAQSQRDEALSRMGYGPTQAYVDATYGQGNFEKQAFQPYAQPSGQAGNFGPAKNIALAEGPYNAATDEWEDEAEEAKAKKAEDHAAKSHLDWLEAKTDEHLQGLIDEVKKKIDEAETFEDAQQKIAEIQSKPDSMAGDVAAILTMSYLEGRENGNS